MLGEGGTSHSTMYNLVREMKDEYKTAIQLNNTLGKSHGQL